MDPKYRIQEWPIHTFDLEFLQSLIIKGQRFLQQPGSSNDNHTNVYCTHTHTQQIVYQQIITSIHAFAVQLEIIKLSNCWSLIIVERVRNEWWSWCNRFRYTNFPRPREQKKKKQQQKLQFISDWANVQMHSQNVRTFYNYRAVQMRGWDENKFEVVRKFEPKTSEISRFSAGFPQKTYD